eukprot:Partr_v1_DN26923_c0_g1_i2_m7207 putative Lipase (class 3)
MITCFIAAFASSLFACSKALGLAPSTGSTGDHQVVLLSHHDESDISAVASWLQLEQLASNAPNSTAAHEFLDSFPSTLENYPAFDSLLDDPTMESVKKEKVDLKPIKVAAQNQLKLMASLAGASYCMSWNLMPKWKCGYPRCENPELTLRSLSNCGEDDLYACPSSSLAADSRVLDEDLLAGTRAFKYLHSSKTATVGYVAVNPLLDNLWLSPGLHAQGISKRTIVVAFRGTMNVRNFLLDLDFARLDFEYTGVVGAKVHGGFLDIWFDVRGQVMDALESIMSQDDPSVKHFDILVIGHSMGGSLATFCALHLRQLAMRRFGSLGAFSHVGPDDSLVFEQGFSIAIKTYTFGQPRTGNQVFARWITSLPQFHLVRSTFTNDLVVHLPPTFIGFRHSAAEFYIDHSRKQTVACDVDQHGDADGEVVIGENPGCSGGAKILSLLSHLHYWDIIFGPWC